jgi:hypothetical protein
MSQLQLQRISKEIIDRAEKAMIPQQGLPKVVDDYFIQRLKQDEMEHAEVDAALYEGMRKAVQAEVLPLYEQYRRETARLRERKQKRKLWQYVLGTAACFELLEALVTRGRSIAPQVLMPTAILYSFIGFIVYTAAQYVDDLQLARARSRLEQSLEGLGGKVQTDADYDNRRQLLDAEVLRAEALEILTHYARPEDFWRDYHKVREADPTVPGELKALQVPAFEKFLKFHINGQHSTVARQHRFNRLFIEAHEVFISRDRERYVLNHLNNACQQGGSDTART